jgi:hypothetical protein
LLLVVNFLKNEERRRRRMKRRKRRKRRKREKKGERGEGEVSLGHLISVYPRFY